MDAYALAREQGGESVIEERGLARDFLMQASLDLGTSFATLPSVRPARQREVGARLERVSFRRDVPHIPTTTYGVFSLYRYPAKFIPQAVAYVIEQYATQGMRVIDPFGGSGTTGLVARLYGLDYEMWDLNPLMGVIHEIATLPPFPFEPETLVQQIRASHNHWLPVWDRLRYWYPDSALELLGQAWGYYHALEDAPAKKLLTIPLLKATKLFSYNDAQRQKLSRSPKATARVEALLRSDYVSRFYAAVYEELVLTARKLHEYRILGGYAHSVNARVIAGVDTLTQSQNLAPQARWDMLITSPPYLQAQEYIRCSKLDLLWLGYTEEYVRSLSKQELPYKDVEPIEVLSPTYSVYRQQITEPHLVRMYDRYFFAVLGALTNISSRVNETLALFVGQATVRGVRVPIDQIFAEHFVHLGWFHEATYIDTIEARVMFRSRTNPATGIEDCRMPTEHMVILRR